MLAIRVNEFGGPDVLRVEEVDIPRPGQDEILVRIVAAGVGPWDVSLRQGGYPGPASLCRGRAAREADLPGPPDSSPHQRERARDLL